MSRGPGIAETTSAPLETRAKQPVDRWLALLAPKVGAMRLEGPASVDTRLDRLAARGVRVTEIGRSREGRPIRALSIGEGPIAIAAIAGAHPDEPVGAQTLIYLAERLATDPRLAGLRSQITLHLCPSANPDGAARNEPWFASWPNLTTYLAKVRRDGPADDVEFGFPSDPSEGVRPENAALARWFDGLGALDHYVSLHSMFLGGGALFLASADDMKAAAPKLRFLLEQADRQGLPLHDKDRGGQKGFHRICPGIQTAPTAEEMRAFFEKGAKAEAAHFKLNSMQYVRKNNGAPLALVSEIPLCYDPRLSSMRPVDRTRAEEELRLADGLDAVLDEAESIAEQLRALGATSVDVMDRQLKTSRATVDAQRGDLARWGLHAATEGNVLETSLSIARRKSHFLALGASLLEGVPNADAFRAELIRRLEASIEALEMNFDLRLPSIETQVQLQLASVLAGLAGPNSISKSHSEES